MTDPFADFPTDLEPRSLHLGPFPHRPFLRAVTRALTPPASDVIVATSADGAVAVVSSGDTTRFAADRAHRGDQTTITIDVVGRPDPVLAARLLSTR